MPLACDAAIPSVYAVCSASSPRSFAHAAALPNEPQVTGRVKPLSVVATGDGVANLVLDLDAHVERQH